MGKLHYNHRKIEGSKLAQVIVKDLAKRIPPNIASKAAFRDSNIDLDASGKNLVDDGAIIEVAHALELSMKYDDPIQGKVVRLEELCLKGCGLDANSLRALIVVIQLAGDDLRDLDLSYNAINIVTEEEVEIWEVFLTSFKKCCVLRRLDLSGNALGHKAFEVLARVYATEDAVDLVLSAEDEESWLGEPQSPTLAVARLESRLRKTSISGDSPGGSPRSPEGSKRGSSRHEPKSSTTTSPSTASTGPLPIYKTTRGLRSVPYLVLCDTAMTDTCALHLSYIVHSHYTPDKLLPRVPGAKAGGPAKQLACYDNETNCGGIIYSTNAAISKAGLKALELAEALRFEDLEEASEDEPEAPPTPTKAGKRAQRASEAEFTPPTVTTGKRRRARTSGGPDDTTELALQRARTRLQINALETEGLHSNELWRTSLKMLCLSREIQPQPQYEPTPKGSSAPPPQARKPIIKTLEVPGYVGGKKPAKQLKPAQSLPLFAERDLNLPIVPYTGPPPPGLPSVPMYQKSWLSHAPPEINLITPTPVPSSGSASDYSDPAASDCSDPPASDSSDPSRPPVAPKHTKSYRTDLPCGFTEEIWCRILGYATNPNEIMSVKQREKMFEWALDRKTLSWEMDHLVYTEAGQIWRVLDGAGCLAYEMET